MKSSTGRAFKGRQAVINKLWLWLAALLFAVVGTAAAQDITGTWQGTLHAPNLNHSHDLRTVLKITKAPDGTLSTAFYSIDQSGQPLSATRTTLEGQSFRMSIVGAGITYEGKLSPDSKTITGTTTQGATALPLNFAKVTEAEAWTIPEPPKRLPPMPASARPAFEVATIKPADPDENGKGYFFQGDQVRTLNTSVNDLITFAFSLQQKQILGGPAWVSSDHFDISGKPDIDGGPNTLQMRGMLEKLLIERFGLKFHYEKRELPVYALTIVKSGNKMTKSKGDPDGLPSMFFQGLGILPVSNATMQDFSNIMQSAVLDRPVVDQTGLTGRWDFTLKWTPDDSQFGGLGVKVPPPSPDAPNAPPALFTAMPEQLGLRLDATKAPVQVLVIDALQKPSAN